MHLMYGLFCRHEHVSQHSKRCLWGFTRPAKPGSERQPGKLFAFTPLHAAVGCAITTALLNQRPQQLSGQE